MNKSKLVRMVTLALFSAIIILMGFTPLGYLKAGVVEITFLLIPVAIGAILFGPTAGAILGTVFGLTSFLQCFGFSPFGAACLSINPFLTFFICVIPRTLSGWFCGLLAKAMQKTKLVLLPYAVPSVSAAIFNTLFFMAALLGCFWNTEYFNGLKELFGTSNLFLFVFAFVGINGLIEIAVCLFLGTALSKSLAVAAKKMKLI